MATLFFDFDMLAKINQFFKGIKTLKFLAQVCRTYFVFKPDRRENPFCLYCGKDYHIVAPHNERILKSQELTKRLQEMAGTNFNFCTGFAFQINENFL